MLVSPKQFLLGSVLLFAALPVLGKEESGSIASLASSSLHASINCPGITSVPITADPEQALPLQTVGSLSCGENVTVLADNEGYTARIRTTTGEEGYVARMYLLNETKAPLAIQPIATRAIATNGVVRWQAGAPGCEHFISSGRQVESVTVNGITVQVSLQDSGWKFRASIAVSNHGDSSVDVVPSLVSLDELKPGLRRLPLQSPKKLQRVTNHQVFRTAANAQPSPSAVALSSAPMASMSSPVYRTPATPDYLSWSSSTDSRAKYAVSGVDSADVAALSLKPASLAAGGQTSGVVWFARDADARELSLRLAVGDFIFDFPLSFRQKR